MISINTHYKPIRLAIDIAIIPIADIVILVGIADITNSN